MKYSIKNIYLMLLLLFYFVTITTVTPIIIECLVFKHIVAFMSESRLVHLQKRLNTLNSMSVLELEKKQVNNVRPPQQDKPISPLHTAD